MLINPLELTKYIKNLFSSKNLDKKTKKPNGGKNPTENALFIKAGFLNFC